MNKRILLTIPALALGLFPMALPLRADEAMPGMDMSGTTTAQKAKPAPLSITATVNPATPRTGDNTLDLLVSDAAGKPVTGLKLTSTVAMTSMDMGTTHPFFTEKGGGHYAATVAFSMDGPWRVVVRNGVSKVAVLDFNAGSKTPWKSPQIKPAVVRATGVAPTPPSAMPGMDMSDGKTMDKKPDDKKPDDKGKKADVKPAVPSGSMAGMDMSGASPKPADNSAGSPDMSGMDMGDAKPMKMTGIADMKTATIPELKETGTYTATGDENWKMQTGFGHNAPMVGMMNQMMVGGSGAEGMKMAPMTMKFGEENYAKPDASDADDSMAGMDMGGKTKTADASKSGSSSKSGDMAGMKMDAPVAASDASAASAPVKIIAEIASAPKAGDNPVTITITDAQGKPVTGARISTSVAMTSMDMGTSHPAVTEKGAGQYTATVNFSMAGPWRVNVKVTPSGQKPQTKSFDFSAK